MNTPTAAEMKSLLNVAKNNGIPLTAPSPSLADGFNGARDAAVLARYDWDKGIGCVHLQACAATRATLKRAGVARIKTHQFYAVSVEWDVKFRRLQLAAPSPAGA